MNRSKNIILIVSILCLFSFDTIYSQNTKLVIKPGGHTSSIRDVIVTKDKKLLISGGDDKTVKIWDIESQTVIDEILGEIGTGMNGVVYSVVLSPDERWLAVSGIMCGDDSYERQGDVRLYDFQTRELVTLFSKHENVVSTACFDQTSSYLISGGPYGELVVWDVKNKKMIRTIQTGTSRIYALTCFGNKVVSIQMDGIVKVHDFLTGEELHKLEGVELPECIAISPDYSTIAVGIRHDMLYLMDTTLKIKQKLNCKVAPSGVSFSPDSKKLITGSYVPTQDQKCRLYQVQNNGKWKLTHTFEEHDWFVVGVTFYDNNTVITAGGHLNEIIFWKPKDDGEIEIVKSIRGKGSPFWGVAKYEEFALYTKKRKAELGASPVNMVFNMITGAKFPLASKARQYIPVPVLEQGDYRFTLEEGGIHNDPEATLVIHHKDSVYSKVTKSGTDGYVHYSLTFLNDSSLLSGGANGRMYKYAREGYQTAYFDGHEGQVWSVTQGIYFKWIITGSGDQTFKIWNLDKAKKRYFYSLDQLHPSWIELCKEEYPDVDLEDSTAVEQLYNALENSTYNREILFYYSIYEPVASVFLSDDGEWVIWSPDGYFKSSKNGAKYIGYHVNNGVDQPASFFPFQQFDLKFNRPDIINKRLELADSSYNDLLYLAYKKRLKKMGVEEENLNAEIHLPEIDISQERIASTESIAQIKLNLSDTKFDLEKVYITINGVPYPSSNGIEIAKGKREEQMVLDIPLGADLNKITASVFNVSGAESLRKTIKVVNPASTKPELYIISIGDGKYQEKEKNLKYAAKDAKDIAALVSTELTQYKDLHIKLLTDEEVVKDSILGLKSFLKDSKIDDHVIIFYAGHGVLNSDFDYYLATYNMDFDNPEENGLLYEDLEALLDEIPSRNKLLIIDACHSGEIDKEEVQLAKNENTEIGEVQFRSSDDHVVVQTNYQIYELMKNTFNDLRQGNGALVISSAGGEEYALEGDQWNNGVFTYTLIYGIETKAADLNNDGEIQISELQQYLSYAVSELTKGKQKPNARSENIEIDFSIF